MKDVTVHYHTTTLDDKMVPWFVVDTLDRVSFNQVVHAERIREVSSLMIDGVEVSKVAVYHCHTYTRVSFFENRIGWDITMKSWPVSPSEMSLVDVINETKRQLMASLSFNNLHDIITISNTNSRRVERLELQNELKSLLGIIE